MRHTRVIVAHYGGPEALRTAEEERPEPKDGEVRVRVLAAGVSLPDIMMREGIHPETPRLPFTPGWDLVGVVDRLGPGVFGIAPEQVVAALPISGAYAEFVCLPQRELVSVPAGRARRSGHRRSCQPRLELRYGVPDAASFGQGQCGPAHPDSRRSRRSRLGTIAAWSPRRSADARHLFIARGVGRFRIGRHSD
jgi:Zn-dependent alcohol dehydrogenase